MQISSTYYAMPRNHVLGIYRMGQNVSRNGQGVFGPRSPVQQNRSPFTPGGSSSGIVDLLNKQKMAIQDRKNELIASAQEKGMSQESIQARLDSYDEQIKEIDKQIGEASVQQMMSATEQQKNAIGKNDNQPKTEQDIQNEKMSNLMALSSGFDRVSITNSVKNRIDGASRVLKTEIELDKGRAGGTATQGKEEELAAMQQQSRALTAEIGEQIADVNEQVQENYRPVDQSEKNEAENANNTANVSEDREEGSTGVAPMFQAMIAQYVQMANMPETYISETSKVNILA